MSLARRIETVDQFSIYCSCMLTPIAGLSAFYQQINVKNSHKITTKTIRTKTNRKKLLN